MAVLNVNGKSMNTTADPRTPLLWVLREQLGLTGTKYGCGIAQCGACTVHIDGVATRSCQVPLNTVGASTLPGYADLPQLAVALREKFTAEETAKLLGGNYRRVFEACMG